MVFLYAMEIFLKCSLSFVYVILSGYSFDVVFTMNYGVANRCTGAFDMLMICVYACITCCECGKNAF